MVTVGDLLTLPSLRGARLEGAASAAGREVRGLTIVRVRPARPQELRAGALLLLPPESGAATVGPGLAAVIRQLARFEPCALVLWEPPPAAAAAVLRECRVPWLVVRPETAAATVEREVSRCVAAYQADLQRLERTAHRELLDLVIHGRGVKAVVSALARLTDKAVALEDAGQRLVQLEWPAGPSSSPARRAAPDRDAHELLNGANAAGVRAWLEGLPVSATDPPTALFDLDGHGWARLVAPVQGGSGLAGLLSLVAPTERFSPRDRLLLKRATAACALELAKQSAVTDAQEQPRGEFVASLLTGDLPEPQVVAHRAARLGYRLGSAHNVLVLRPAGELAAGGQGDRRLEELLAWRLGAEATGVPYRARQGLVAVVLPVEQFREPRDLAAWAAGLHQQLAADCAPHALSAGLGQAHDGVAGIHQAYEGAVWALDLGERLFGPGGLTRLQDLGVYRLLLALQQQPSLREFYEEMLGPLAAYDRQKRAELVPTLEAYVAAGNSPSETAARLHLHRNTVLYRLRRIRALLGRDPDDPEQRLSLQLALRARLVLDAQRALPEP
ncbi:MAG TPA: helix-turn-helix domain-containing protein [Chloroflexota bacterium]|nr:helix-turn-helix domain-containing protein [Chloroflexota bacterium]